MDKLMPNANSIQPDKNVSILMKSAPGFGKTIAACSFAIYGDVFLAYFDKRVPVELLAFFRKHRPDLLKRIDYEVYGSSNANEYLNKLISFRNDCKYATIITDSVTSLSSAAVNWSMGFRDPKGGKADKLNPKSPQLIPDWDEYKVETSLVTQALDISKSLPVFNIWTAHPLPQLSMSGSGPSMVITKTQSLVSYGNKVGALVPGQFTEIYHFGRKYDGSRIVLTDSSGEDFAKTSFNLPKELDITDKLFAEVWRDAVTESFKEVSNDGVKEGQVDPFPSKKPWEM
jgi:hypothetical protein